MKHLDINFVRPSVPGKWAWWGLGAMIVGALFAMWHAQGLHDELTRQTALQDRARAADAVPPLTPSAAPAPYDQAARHFLRLAQWPWPQALTATEANQTVSMALSALELSSSDRLVRVELRAPNYEALLRWIQEQNLQSEGLEPACWQWTLTEASLQAGGDVVAKIQGNCPNPPSGVSSEQ